MLAPVASSDACGRIGLRPLSERGAMHQLCDAKLRFAVKVVCDAGSHVLCESQSRPIGVRQTRRNFQTRNARHKLVKVLKNPPCIAGWDKMGSHLIFRQIAPREATSYELIRAQAGEARPPSRTLTDGMGKWTP